MATYTTGVATLATVVYDGSYPTGLGCYGFLRESPSIFGAVGRTPVNQVMWDGMVECCNDEPISIWQDGETCEAYCHATSSAELQDEYTCLKAVPTGVAHSVTECLDDGSGICDVLRGEYSDSSSSSFFLTSSTSTSSSVSSTRTSSSSSSKSSSLATSTITSSARAAASSPATSAAASSSAATVSVATASSSTTSSKGAAATGKIELGLAAMMLMGVLAL